MLVALASKQIVGGPDVIDFIVAHIARIKHGEAAQNCQEDDQDRQDCTNFDTG